MIGRSAELALVRDGLDRGQIVQIVGPPGIGKSTLAQRAVDGRTAAWVPLESVAVSVPPVFVPASESVPLSPAVAVGSSPLPLQPRPPEATARDSKTAASTGAAYPAGWIAAGLG